MAVLITYKGSTIAALTSPVLKTFYTSGKYCEDNIVLNYNKSYEENAFINRTLSIYTNNDITTIGEEAFISCSNLTAVSFPACTTISAYAFNGCSNLTTVTLPACTTIMGYAFYNCVRFISLYLPGSTIVSLASYTALSSTPIDRYSAIAGTFGSIYVPASLLASYKSARNWSYFQSRFVGI